MQRCAWKGKAKNGNGKEMGKNVLLSFPVPPFFGNLFSRFWPKSSKKGEKRCNGEKAAGKMWKEATGPFFPFPDSRIW